MTDAFESIKAVGTDGSFIVSFTWKSDIFYISQKLVVLVPSYRYMAWEFSGAQYSEMSRLLSIIQSNSVVFSLHVSLSN